MRRFEDTVKNKSEKKPRNLFQLGTVSKKTEKGSQNKIILILKKEDENI